MSDFDLTVALTAHAETVISGPTMRSAEQAITALELEGYRVERIIGFDNPKPGTMEYFSQPAFRKWGTFEFEFKDQGKSRNELARLANGRWLAFLDGDDLFSENWLTEAVRILDQDGADDQNLIVHPELNWGFDAQNFILGKTPEDDPLFSPYYFYFANYYDALCVAPRRVWLENLYADRAVADGFAYEDWQWSIETIARGWKHVVAKDTIVFKRRRDESQTLEASRNSVWIRRQEALSIENMSGEQAGNPAK